MKPGASTSPRASTTESPALGASFPICWIVPPAIRTSAMRLGPPDPSTTIAPRMSTGRAGACDMAGAATQRIKADRNKHGATIGPPETSTMKGTRLYSNATEDAMRALIPIICLLICPGLAVSQQSASHSRSDQIASAFTKHKSVVKVKDGIRSEKYKD